MYLNISLVLLFGIIAIPGVGAHGYVTSPRSRNFVASQDGKWWGGTSNDPDMESCPHCLNRGGLCGLIGDHDYNYPKNALGGPMPLNIQEILQKGQEFDFSAVLTAHHKGHFEYKACPIQAGEVPTQECFDNYPLEFVKDILYNAPQDPNYPERAYIPLSSHSSVKDSAGSYLYTHTYKLPMDISGDIVLIQWHYVTANSCLPEGYNDYDWPEGFYPGNSDTCGPLPVDGNGVPEQFWNCVEVKITSDSTPTEPPVSSPTENPTNTSPVNPPVPTIAPMMPPTSPDGDGTAGPDSRLIAYVGNWQSCPSLEETSQYTHIVIAFAVTYTWDPSKNQCSQSCTIGSPVPICNNQNNQALVDSWRAAGKKVILSFGGAGMGGSWAGDVNDCWEYCYGKEESVIGQLDTIVKAQNFDGIDIDYEYFYTSAQAQNFLKTVTTGLRSVLPPGSIVTHAPMDPDLLPSTAYYNVLKEVSSSLDFIMPQYYNGFTRPAIDGIDGTGSGSISALSHYNTLVNDMFDGDATKVIFGFCISDCSGTDSNANAVQAADIMSSLREYYPCNGGAFFWVAAHDTGGSWSQIVGNEILPYSGCSDESPTISPRPTMPPTFPVPTFPPTAVPTLPPVPPTASPTLSPVQSGTCPPGYSGLIPTSDCKGYYHCLNGSLVTDIPTYCQDGLLFNSVLQVCDWEDNVDCAFNPTPPISTTSPTAAPTISPVSPTVSPTAAQTLPPVPPTIAPTESPVQVATCPAEYTGLIPANGCTVFYHCLNGSLVSEVPIYCPEGLLYTSDEVCMCNFVFVL